MNTLGPKRSGKTNLSIVRRPRTRESGYKTHSDTTGGQYKINKVDKFLIKSSGSMSFRFVVKYKKDEFCGFGGYYKFDGKAKISIPSNTKMIFTAPEQGNWSKFGTMFLAEQDGVLDYTVVFEAETDCVLSFYDLSCGIIYHDYLKAAKDEKPVLLKNMYQFSPEANFYINESEVKFESYESLKSELQDEIILKSCNRCGRYLPINTKNERLHLSFANHCVASTRLPCSHKLFSQLKNIDSDEVISLKHGYQLECRFCKKFEVNAALNPQRTAAQMKEDGARRRAFESLLAALYEKSSQLNFRKVTGNELTDVVWEKFGGKCFNCGVALNDKKKMHLDHTRPLALLWPLDETATCLCGSCNSQKRDRSPVDFYVEDQLKRLAQITKIAYEDLISSEPNNKAIKLLLEQKDWFFNDFCKRDLVNGKHDGKNTVDLLIKALDKAISKSTEYRKIRLSSLKPNDI